MTDFTRTSPTSAGLLPEAFAEIGGIVLDLVGLNGVRVTSQLAASGLFVGFFDGGDPIDFRGNPGTIGIQRGFGAEVLSALGGGIAEVGVRVTLFDGDTAAGEFDFNQNRLLLNGIDFGDFSDVLTEVTSEDGLVATASEFGFGDSRLNTGWFYSDNADLLQQLFESLVSAEISFQLSDIDPFDNFFDFTRGIDVELIDVGAGVNVSPVAQPDNFMVLEDEKINGSLFADNGNGPDVDADGDPLNILSINGDVAIVGQQIELTSGALVTVQRDGSFSFDTNGNFLELNQGEEVSESFFYTVTDGQAFDTAEVVITIVGVNEAPIARNDLFLNAGGVAFSGDLFADNGSGIDLDPDNDPIRVAGHP